MNAVRALVAFVCCSNLMWSCEDHPAGVAPSTAAAIGQAKASVAEVPPGEAVTTVDPIAINRTPPVEESLPTTEHLLANPTSANLRQLRLFSEPLSPRRVPTNAENQVLGDALRAFVKNPETTLLERFLVENTDSPWAGSLALNLGMIHRRHGRFSKALASWTRAWEELRSERDSEALVVLADRAAGELAQFYTWIGETDRLTQLLSEAKGRRSIGPGAERLEAARMALGFMRETPESVFICGPLAIDTLCRLNGVVAGTGAAVAACQATARGTNLKTLTDLAERVGLRYRPAKRSSGADIPLPALIHWKLDHFGVIAKREGNRYLIVDQTFDSYQGRELWVDQEALE
jgi:hypothetical protein